MTTEQQSQAQHLYFQSDRSRKDIAAAIGVPRSVLYSWIDQHNWHRIRASARCMPTVIADNCYQVLGNLTEHLLSAERAGQPVTIQEANAIFKLTATIQKLKNTQTTSESMETFARFADHISAKDAALAEKVAPHIDEFIALSVAPPAAPPQATLSTAQPALAQKNSMPMAQPHPASPIPPPPPLPATPHAAPRTDNPAPPPGKVPRIIRSAA